MTPQEKTIDTIKKLMAKANNEATTQAEAAAFAAKAAELAAREQLELSDIDWEERKQGQPIGTYHFWPEDHDIKRSKVRVKWMEDIISEICLSQGCRFILMGGNTYDIIGRKSNVEIASYLCAFLIRFVLIMSERDYNAHWKVCQDAGDVTLARGFKNSWRIGFVDEVRRRMREMREEIKEEFKSSTALVRLTNERDEVRAWMDENLTLGRANALRRGSNRSAAGVSAGRSAGSKVDVTGRGVGSSPTKQIR